MARKIIEDDLRADLVALAAHPMRPSGFTHLPMSGRQEEQRLKVTSMRFSGKAPYPRLN